MLWHGNWRNLEFKVAVLPASSPAAGVHEDNMPSNPKKKQKFHYRKKEKKKKKAYALSLTILPIKKNKNKK